MSYLETEVDSRRPVGVFSTTSTTYVNVLDNAGGAVYSCTVTKGASTDILIFGHLSAYTSGSNTTVTLGVNDGTADYDLGINRIFTTSSRRNSVEGAKLITGLGAGTFTFTLRVKTAAGTLNCDNAGRPFITAIEVPSGTSVGVAYGVPSSNQSYSTVTYVDLTTDGSTPIQVTGFNKVSATSKLWVFARMGCIGVTSSIYSVLGVHDGTNDNDVTANQIHTTPHNDLVGEYLITGLPSGSRDLKLRIRTGNATNTCSFQTLHSATLVVIEVP